MSSAMTHRVLLMSRAPRRHDCTDSRAPSAVHPGTIASCYCHLLRDIFPVESSLSYPVLTVLRRSFSCHVAYGFHGRTNYGEAMLAVIESRGADDSINHGPGSTQRPAGDCDRDGREQHAIHPLHRHRLAGDGGAEFCA